MSVPLVCPQCSRRQNVPDRLASSGIIYTCSQCGHRDLVSMFAPGYRRRREREASAYATYSRSRSLGVGSGSSYSVGYDMAGSAEIVPQIATRSGVRDTSVDMRGAIREEFRHRLISVVPNSILETVVESISRQINLRADQDSYDNFGGRPLLDLRWSIDDRRNGLYVTPIECKDCGFVFYVNNGYLESLSLRCPQCVQDIGPGHFHNLDIPDSKKTIVEDKKNKEEIRMIRCNTRK